MTSTAAKIISFEDDNGNITIKQWRSWLFWFVYLAIVGSALALYFFAPPEYAVRGSPYIYLAAFGAVAIVFSIFYISISRGRTEVKEQEIEMTELSSKPQ